MGYENVMAWLLAPLPNDVTEANWESIGHTVLKIFPFEGFASKPCPLMNINQIGSNKKEGPSTH